MEVHKKDLDLNDPWSGMLAAAMYAIRATVHTTLNATPMQLVFGRDANLNTRFDADWNLIKQRKENLIKKNNLAENKKRTPHKYNVGDKILIKRHLESKYGSGNPYSEPMLVTQINDNGTIRYSDGKISDTINMRNVHPYRE